MAGEWSKVRIADLGRVMTGRTPPGNAPTYYDGDVQFLTPSDMVGRRRVERTARSLSPYGAKQLARCLVPYGVGVSCIGWQMGKAVLIDRPTVTNQQINSVVVSENVADCSFVYYSFLARRAELFNLGAGGSRTPILNKGDFERLPFILPPLPEQRAIAHILGTLDDKIELNQRMNETLEAMVRALFKSWFVDTIQNGIPQDWREGEVEELATLNRETINPREFREETFDHYSIPAFDEGRLPKAEYGEQIQSNKFIVPSNAVLLSKLNPRIPRVWLPNVKAARRSICSTEFLVTTPQTGVSPEYLYALFGSLSFLEVFSTLVTGTSGSHQRVKPEYLLAMDVLIPPKELMARFTETVGPMYQRTAQNIEESRTLATIRDTLLPKLISGELRVPEGTIKLGGRA